MPSVRANRGTRNFNEAGYSALTTGEIWQDHPEKAFTMRADWVDKNPKATKALLMAARSPDLVRQAGKQRGDGTNRLQVSVAQHISEKCGTSQRQLRLRRRSRGEEQPVHYEVLVK